MVTSEDDEETREVCRRYSLDCLLTEDWKIDGNFAKGRIIERGLQHLRKEGWRVHMDADLILPRDTRRLLDAAHLNPQKIYGIDRVMVQGFEKWQKFQQAGWMHHSYQNNVKFPEGFSVGARWVDIREGYVPIGFFQMWHSDTDIWRGTRIRRYPQAHNDACRTDTQHSLQWDRQDRELLPELIGVHLESESTVNGTNWNGRKTKRFGPEQGWLKKHMKTASVS